MSKGENSYHEGPGTLYLSRCSFRGLHLIVQHVIRCPALAQPMGSCAWAYAHLGGLFSFYGSQAQHEQQPAPSDWRGVRAVSVLGSMPAVSVIVANRKCPVSK